MLAFSTRLGGGTALPVGERCVPCIWYGNMEKIVLRCEMKRSGDRLSPYLLGPLLVLCFIAQERWDIVEIVPVGDVAHELSKRTLVPLSKL